MDRVMRSRLHLDAMLLGIGLVVLAVAATSARGEGVTLFQDVPSADEVIDALGAGAPRPPMAKMRGSAPTPTEDLSRTKTPSVVFSGGQVVGPAGPPVTPASLVAPGAPVEKATAKPASANVSTSGGASGAALKPPTQAAAKPKTTGSVAFGLTFDLNSAELTAEARRYVDTIAEAMRKKPDMILEISGHTDARGSDDLNNGLSLRRAQAVHRYLIETHKIDARRMTVAGEGAHRPLDSKNPYAEVNRRVEFAKQGDGCDAPQAVCGKTQSVAK